jgi:hypothetical protein
MAGSRSVADSHAWEQKCKQLLAIRYRDELQLIDASRAGDLGLEAFTRDSACGFQCYAALEPLSTQELYKKQRNKLTTDLDKLVANEVQLAVILGTTKLRRYVFMVPRFDPPLLEHCGRKAREMQAKGLSILDPSFDIVVHTDENYPVERAQLIELALEPLRLNIREVNDVERTNWTTEHAPLVDTLMGKIVKFGVTAEEQEVLRNEFLNHFLRREQLLHLISNEAPETRIRIEGRIRDREHLLYSARLMTVQPPREHAMAVIKALTAELREESKAIQATGAEALAWGTAADWLIRCPLDF